MLGKLLIIAKFQGKQKRGIWSMVLEENFVREDKVTEKSVIRQN